MTLFGPDGKTPVGARKVRATEGGLEYEDAAGVRRVDPKQVLMNAARMQRDGMSLEGIMDALDLVGDARNPFLLQRALDQGHVLLKEAIARGEEPENTTDAPQQAHNPAARDEDDD